jgi:predicted membrane chloride channel (bestrophin family)
MNRELALGRISITVYGLALITVLAWSEHMSLGVAVALFYCLALNIGISLSIRKRNKEEAK